MRFLRIGATGLRGEVGTALTPPLVIRFATAFGTWLCKGTVGVCSDPRTSSPMIKSAVISGLLSCGCNVIDFGILPSAVLHFAVRHYKLDGGLIIGPGHHKQGWNAIVAVSSRGSCLTPVQTQEMLDIYHSSLFHQAEWNEMGKILKKPDDVIDAYLNDLLGLVDAEKIAKRHFRVVMDFCNGSGSVLYRQLAERLHLDVIPINDQLSGILPHEPEPRPRSSVQVRSLMAPLKADAGFVFSSDVGRAAVVSDTGETLSEEYTFPLAAQSILSKAPHGSVVATNVCTTRTLDDVVAAHGGVLCKGKVGEAFTADLMFEKDACLAGDGSGGLIIGRSGTAGFDGFAAASLILGLMAESQTFLSGLAKALPRYHIVKFSLQCPSVKAYQVLNRTREMFDDAVCSSLDGLRFDWPEGWIHIRMSRTEPILRMILEWKDRKTAVGKAMHVRAALERMIAK